MASTPKNKKKRQSLSEISHFGRMSLQEMKLKRLQNEEDYTDDILRERLAYVDETLKSNEETRNITPRSMNMLNTYRKSVVIYLGMSPDDDNKHMFLEVIIELDEFFEKNNIELEKMNVKQREIEQRLAELQRLELFARYGDYFAYQLKHLRDNAVKCNTESSKYLKTYWTAIAASIEVERPIAEKNEYTSSDEIQTWVAVLSASRAIGIDPKHAYDCIQAYAQRNELFHTKINETIQQAKFMDLARVLFEDEKTLKEHDYPEFRKESIAMRAIIDTIKDKFFTIPEGYEDNYQAWAVTRAGIKASEDKPKTYLDTIQIESAAKYVEDQKHIDDGTELMRRLIRNQRIVYEPPTPLSPNTKKELESEGQQFAKCLKWRKQGENYNQQANNLIRKSNEELERLKKKQKNEASSEEE